jgi:predicted DsbA family dithiol-disulfide isomerase
VSAVTLDPFRDPTLVNQDRGVVTVWSDIGCPWATLALHTLHNRARELDLDLLVDHRAFPLELFNRRPTPKSVIDVEVTVIAGLVPELGWRLWSGSDASYAVTMLPALTAVQAAKQQSVGGLRASDELDTALRRAFYEEARCISIHAEILDVAERCPSVFVPALDKALQRGEGTKEVFDQWRTARELPVQGSPHIFVGDTYAEHNPGVDYQWTAPPGKGFPRFDDYDRGWADTVLQMVASWRPL